MMRQFQFLLLWLALGNGSLFLQPISAANRPFQFGADSIAFPNELKWEYGFDPNGHWSGHKRIPSPGYSLHCFVLARTAAQFYRFAEFHPELPKTNSATYKELIQAISRSNLRRAESKVIPIPGYTNLNQFSAEQEPTFKISAGGASQSYFQRGNWRMVFPFSRKNQERTANRLMEQIEKQGESTIHVVRFPKLDLNHAILLYRFQKTESEINFSFYDPNNPETPRTLVYNLKARTFSFPRTDYFRGGSVNVYRIYTGCFY